jgi:hypothetical protein
MVLCISGDYVYLIEEGSDYMRIPRPTSRDMQGTDIYISKKLVVLYL